MWSPPVFSVSHFNCCSLIETGVDIFGSLCPSLLQWQLESNSWDLCLLASTSSTSETKGKSIKMKRWNYFSHMKVPNCERRTLQWLSADSNLCQWTHYKWEKSIFGFFCLLSFSGRLCCNSKQEEETGMPLRFHPLLRLPFLWWRFQTCGRFTKTNHFFNAAVNIGLNTMFSRCLQSLY